jgi:hypothetical protein
MRSSLTMSTNKFRCGMKLALAAVALFAASVHAASASELSFAAMQPPTRTFVSESAPTIDFSAMCATARAAPETLSFAPMAARSHPVVSPVAAPPPPPPTAAAAAAAAAAPTVRYVVPMQSQTTSCVWMPNGYVCRQPVQLFRRR